jgi:hypothetical protein
MFFVIWYEGWSENIYAFDSKDEAARYIEDTGMDPDEFEIMEGDFPDV